MRIRYLGPYSPLVEFLSSFSDDVMRTEERILACDDDFIVSYNYRHILKEPIISKFNGRAINLHISYLPWNRGADPNLWSFIDQTPKGVTIHYIDAGIDTGDIIAQRKIDFESGTLASTYRSLQEEICSLFREQWAAIRRGTCGRKKQEGRGTFHLARDRITVEHLLTEGWDTPVHALRMP